MKHYVDHGWRSFEHEKKERKKLTVILVCLLIWIPCGPPKKESMYRICIGKAIVDFSKSVKDQ